MLSGFGKLFFETLELDATAIAQNLMYAPDLLDFTLDTSTDEARKAKAWRDCKRVTVASAPGEEERSLTVQLANVDWAVLQLAEGEIAENVNVTLPAYKVATIPSVSPYEITDAEITAGNQDKVKAYLQGKVGSNVAGPLTRVATAPSSAKEFQADGANTKLIFEAGLAGGAIAYSIPKAYTSIPSIGKAPDPVRISSLSFIGHACGDEFPEGVLIHIPKIARSGRPTYNTADDIPTLELPFECLVAPGERSPVHFYLEPAA